MADIAPDLLDSFKRAVETMDERFPAGRLATENADRELRRWLDGDDEPLAWTDPARVTEDEWFFISTLYGEMTVSSQRAHIRKFFPLLFVGAAARDIRSFVHGMEGYRGLRSAWMSRRLVGWVKSSGIGESTWPSTQRDSVDSIFWPRPTTRCQPSMRLFGIIAPKGGRP